MKNLKYITLSVMALGLSSCVGSPSHISNGENAKAVGHVNWQISNPINPEELINKPIPEDSVSIFFLRPQDNDPEQTSANIAINDRFQVSLHPGHYTQVYSCSGINRLSAEITGLKTNDLLANSIDFNLAPNSNYFFYVDVDNEGNSTIQEVTNEKALEYLQDKSYQSHQITRVVPNCPVAEPKPIPPVVEPAPVLEKEVSIELEVLFDNDKAIVKPQYYNEVQELAEFMQKYSNTTAVIEGHTDSNASDEYNQKLSERRANAIKYILISKFNISPDRLEAVGYGEQRPRATNKTAEGRQLNRRTIAVIRERVRVDQDGNQIIN
ncbi:OmpA family protein [Psychrobacter sp. FDAARGOS_221]|uniref:OmpA family protein n=1 Tax=Psychrobacter sp. FDAARGOS_221 TaxID=1975705 RepID=UPI000BB53FC5|nr:OmpA family protein [Psychrobacter sp. FDAARGOS_221]PNK61437.1 OmpA family protein [Psychrobacter sp. FDAARGOS_221]